MEFLLLTVALIFGYTSASTTTIRVRTNDYLMQKIIYNLTSNNYVSVRKLPPGRSGHVITKDKDKAQTSCTDQIVIDISGLNKIVNVRNFSQTIIVESGCSMETLLNVSLANGLIPKVLPEFRDITVGGAIVGFKIYRSTFFLLKLKYYIFFK